MDAHPIQQPGLRSRACLMIRPQPGSAEMVRRAKLPPALRRVCTLIDDELERELPISTSDATDMYRQGVQAGLRRVVSLMCSDVRTDRKPFCPTCGTDTEKDGDCAVCIKWWAENPPPVPAATHTPTRG